MGKSIQKERIGPYEIVVKEFYAKMTVIHLKKKDIVKSKVRGVEIEFDHEKLATILGIHRNNGIYEYVKDVWEESKYIKPLEITRRGRRAGDETQRVQSYIFDSTKDQEHCRSRPLGSYEREMLNLRSSEREFERKRANRFHDELEKAKVENAKLLALLHKTQTKPHP
ncbi:hypothetical protein Dimus_010408 [Dionaea muscipula]